MDAIALNPRILGIGGDENTAAIVKHEPFEVIGSGAAYVVEAASATLVGAAQWLLRNSGAPYLNATGRTARAG